jgi:hypothetical protein
MTKTDPFCFFFSACFSAYTLLLNPVSPHPHIWQRVVTGITSLATAQM